MSYDLNRIYPTQNSKLKTHNSSDASETSVIILNWNGARLLPACLSALSTQTYRDFDLWLVDNGSIDESSQLLDELERSSSVPWLPAAFRNPVRIIRNSQNKGFAAGNNQALKLNRSRYVVLLNNDAIPEPAWLGSLVSTAIASGPTVGMVASTMLFSHRPGIVASAGISIHRDGVALDRAVGMSRAQLEEKGVCPVFGPSAGAALYFSTLLRDVGLFDERFFSYLEDADLAWRARSRGWGAVHDPYARILHEYSATGGHNSPFKKRLLSRNRVWLLYKNMPEALFRRNAPAILRYDLLVALRALLTRDKAVLYGRAEALRTLRHFSEDRRKVATASTLHPDELNSLLAPPLSPRLALKFRSRLDSLLLPSP